MHIDPLEAKFQHWQIWLLTQWNYEKSHQNLVRCIIYLTGVWVWEGWTLYPEFSHYSVCFGSSGSSEGGVSGGHASSDPEARRPRSVHPGGGSGSRPASGGPRHRRPGQRAAFHRPERHGQDHRERKLPQQGADHQAVRMTCGYLRELEEWRCRIERWPGGTRGVRLETRTRYH